MAIAQEAHKGKIVSRERAGTIIDHDEIVAGTFPLTETYSLHAKAGVLRPYKYRRGRLELF
jgi:hypothetical protein